MRLNAFNLQGALVRTATEGHSARHIMINAVKKDFKSMLALCGHF